MKWRSVKTGKYVSEYYAKRHPTRVRAVEGVAVNSGENSPIIAREWLDAVPIMSESFDRMFQRVSDWTREAYPVFDEMAQEMYTLELNDPYYADEEEEVFV